MALVLGGGSPDCNAPPDDCGLPQRSEATTTISPWGGRHAAAVRPGKRHQCKLLAKQGRQNHKGRAGQDMGFPCWGSCYHSLAVLCVQASTSTPVVQAFRLPVYTSFVRLTAVPLCPFMGSGGMGTPLLWFASKRPVTHPAVNMLCMSTGSHRSSCAAARKPFVLVRAASQPYTLVTQYLKPAYTAWELPWARLLPVLTAGRYRRPSDVTRRRVGELGPITWYITSRV